MTDKEKVLRYINRRPDLWTIPRIANATEIKNIQVREILKSLKIEITEPGKGKELKPEIKTCPECGKTFETGTYKPQQIYCNHICRERAWERKHVRNRKGDRKEYMRLLRIKRKRNGCCITCGRKNPNKDMYVNCSDCLDRKALTR